MLLNEFFNPTGFDTTAFRANMDLNPVLFNKNRRMHAQVRNRLLVIAREFLSTLKLNKPLEALDIILGGSNANYNYGPDSDIDLHIRVDLSKVFPKNWDMEGVTIPLIKDYLLTKKNEWNRKREIKFADIPVEIYVEDLDTPPTTGGIFSILKNEWLVEPRSLFYKQQGVDQRDLAPKKAAEWSIKIKKAIATGDADAMRECFADIRTERAAKLNQGDETSIENLAYKLLRNRGDINKLFDAIDKALTDRLSIPRGQNLNEFALGGKKVTYSKRLNPDIWNGDKLKPEVRDKLIQIANAFKAFIGLKVSVLDIRFKGSMANYNYTKDSDIDVHLIAEVTPEEASFIDAKRIAWKAKYQGINVYGYPVELSVDRPDHIHSSSAVYSLSDDAWIDQPRYQKPETNLDKAETLFKRWKAELQAAIKSGDIKTIKDTEGKIRGKRDRVLKGSPDPEQRRRMEISAENVAFKWLRDTGILDTVKKLSDEDRVGRLSLEKQRTLLGLLGL